MVDQAGLHIFPCKADKTPAIRQGHNAATNDPNIIRQWWGHALLGAPCGPVNDFDVLDVDRGGEDWLATYEATHGLPATRIVGTKSGGLHIYFRHHVGLKCSAGLMAPNVDIRSSGGYVILWDRAGLPVLSDAPVAPWPAPMLELLREAEEARRGRYALAPKQPGWGGVTACNGLLPRPLWAKMIELMSGAPDLNHRRVSGILRPAAEARENRNRELYEAALQFRELIGANIIGRTSVEELLFMAMEINGYVEEKLNGAYRAKGTIKSGLNAKRYG
jgi:hypothetical protein